MPRGACNAIGGDAFYGSVDNPSILSQRTRYPQAGGQVGQVMHVGHVARVGQVGQVEGNAEHLAHRGTLPTAHVTPPRKQLYYRHQ